MPNYQESMRESCDAHQNFKSVWRVWRSGKLKDAKGLKPHTEPKSVSDGRNLFLAKNDLLFISKIQPLEMKFKENPNHSLDEVIEFLLVDIPAFRCGYAKEVFLKLLKNIEFTNEEIKRLQILVINICETKSFRREFRRCCHLAVKIADADFVNELKNLTQTENIYAKVKSKWILAMIFQNRVDLRKPLS